MGEQLGTDTSTKNESSKGGFFANFTKEALPKILVGLILAIPFSAIGTYIVRIIAPPQAVPIGTIVAWNGKGSLPDGWAICDGNKEVGTPNLRGLFLKGVGNSADANITTDNLITAVTNTFWDGTAQRPGISIPAGTPINIPPNYTVVYIMKVK